MNYPAWYVSTPAHHRNTAVAVWFDEAFGGLNTDAVRFARMADLHFNVLTVLSRGSCTHAHTPVARAVVDSLYAAAVELTP